MTGLAKTFFHADLVEAWKQAASTLANQAATPYVIVTSFGTAWTPGNAGVRRLDTAAKSKGFDSPSSVASVLCPQIVRQTVGPPSQAIEAGQIMFGRGRRRGIKFSGWGHTYFERLTGAWYDRKGTKNTIKNNRLLSAIQKINQWDKNSEAALYLHTDLPTDNFRTRGSPCLQYIQIRSFGANELSVAALYRSHDYSNKALGNFLGLNELGCFIADRTGRTFRGVDVISLNPFVSGKKKTNEFIEQT